MFKILTVKMLISLLFENGSRGSIVATPHCTDAHEITCRRKGVYDTQHGHMALLRLDEGFKIQFRCQFAATFRIRTHKQNLRPIRISDV
jgi:hypothetical protein